MLPLSGQVFLFANARHNRMTLESWCGIPIRVVRDSAGKRSGGVGYDSANFESRLTSQTTEPDVERKQ
jgi:hypothetical protein